MLFLKLLSFANLSYQKTVGVSLLYERNLKPFESKFTLELLNNVLGEYNKRLIDSNVRFVIISIMDYSEYSKHTSMRDYSKHSGNSDLNLKLKDLSKINKNLIVLYNSGNVNEGEFNSVNTCRDRYFVNISQFKYSSDEVSRICLEAIKKYMKSMLKVSIPEFYELDNNIMIGNHESEDLNSSIYPEVVEEIKDCPMDGLDDNKAITLNTFKDKTNNQQTKLKYQKGYKPRFPPSNYKYIKGFEHIRPNTYSSNYSKTKNIFARGGRNIIESESDTKFGLDVSPANRRNIKNMRNVSIEPEQENVKIEKMSTFKLKKDIPKKNYNDDMDSSSIILDDNIIQHRRINKRFISPNEVIR